jgi:hypothetical protein
VARDKEGGTWVEGSGLADCHDGLGGCTWMVGRHNGRQGFWYYHERPKVGHFQGLCLVCQVGREGDKVYDFFFAGLYDVHGDVAQQVVSNEDFLSRQSTGMWHIHLMKPLAVHKVVKPARRSACVLGAFGPSNPPRMGRCCQLCRPHMGEAWCHPHIHRT